MKVSSSSSVKLIVATRANLNENRPQSRGLFFYVARGRIADCAIIDIDFKINRKEKNL